MAIFSTSESTGSVIKRAEQEFQDGVFKQWVFEIVDEKSNSYEWQDTSQNLEYGSAPTDTQVSQYIHAYLTGGNKGGDPANGTYDGVTKIAVKKVFRNRKVKKSLININPNGTPDTDHGEVYTPDAVSPEAVSFSTHSTLVKTFVASDTTPSVKDANMFNTHTGTLTITDFDDAEQFKRIIVFSKGAITFDVTSSGLIGGTTNIVTADGDVTEWVYSGTKWYLTSFMDVSASLTGGH